MTSTWTSTADPSYHGRMGFNPFRPHERDIVDIVVVATALAITIGVLAWALWG